jgi:uncharacterized RDD family membrane protein YckC
MQRNSSSASLHISLARRLGAILYDFLLLATILIFASLFFAIPFNITPEHPLFIIYQSYIYVISFFFYAWSWTRGGQTLGMKTWKFKITRLDGSSMNWLDALIRFVVAIISWLPFGLGYLWSLFDKQKRTWHDIASKTQLTPI